VRRVGGPQGAGRGPHTQPTVHRAGARAGARAVTGAAVWGLSTSRDRVPRALPLYRRKRPNFTPLAPPPSPHTPPRGPKGHALPLLQSSQCGIKALPRIPSTNRREKVVGGLWCNRSLPYSCAIIQRFNNPPSSSKYDADSWPAGRASGDTRPEHCVMSWQAVVLPCLVAS